MNQEHFINNQWVKGSGEPFATHDSATQKVIWQGHAAAEMEVDAAIKAARNAFASWSALPIQKRMAYLEAFREALTKASDSLAETISKEVGKPLWESKTEVAAMLGKINISIDAYQNRCPTVMRDLPTGHSITRHKPHGIIAIFGPFNFPGHLPNGHIIPALLAGNTVIFKPSESAPLVAEKMIQLWEQCHLPAGVINMIQGGRDTGRLLADHPQIDGLFFTGSWQTGQIFSEKFAGHPEKILALEMGGNNPLVVDELDDIRAAAYLTIQSAYITAGQRCTCARRLIVLEGQQGDEFIKQLVQMIKAIRIGHYTDQPEPFMGPVISLNAAKHLLSAQDTLKSQGGIPLADMRMIKENSPLLTPGLMDVTHIAKRPDEEFFGPFLQLIRVKSFEAAIAEANRTEYGLTAGLLSKHATHYEQFFQNVRAGVINWNTPLTGASSAAPFGGVGKSGNYRPSAYYAADYCAYPVASIESAECKMPSTLSPGIKIT